MAVAQRSTPPMSNVTISPCAKVLDVSSVRPFRSQKMCTSSNGISIWTIPSTTLSSLTVHCDDGCVAVSLRDANGNSVLLPWRQVSLITSGRWKNCSCSTASLFPNKRDTTWTFMPRPNRYRWPWGINPTATSIFDLSATTRYAPPVYPAYHQEAPYVSSLSDQRRRLCHSHV